ncbi:hypothetical protein DIPPA_19705 [Diplonema papillatum]|nr:hypothetical protein DIPPA_19705 [Diplonema papillatum]
MAATKRAQPNSRNSAYQSPYAQQHQHQQQQHHTRKPPIRVPAALAPVPQNTARPPKAKSGGGGTEDPAAAGANVLAALLREQQRANELLREIIAGGGSAGGVEAAKAKEEEVRKTTMTTTVAARGETEGWARGGAGEHCLASGGCSRRGSAASGIEAIRNDMMQKIDQLRAFAAAKRQQEEASVLRKRTRADASTLTADEPSANEQPPVHQQHPRGDKKASNAKPSSRDSKRRGSATPHAAYTSRHQRNRVSIVLRGPASRHQVPGVVDRTPKGSSRASSSSPAQTTNTKSPPVSSHATAGQDSAATATGGGHSHQGHQGHRGQGTRAPSPVPFRLSGGPYGPIAAGQDELWLQGGAQAEKGTYAQPDIKDTATSPGYRGLPGSEVSLASAATSPLQQAADWRLGEVFDKSVGSPRVLQSAATSPLVTSLLQQGLQSSSYQYRQTFGEGTQEPDSTQTPSTSTSITTEFSNVSAYNEQVDALLQRVREMDEEAGDIWVHASRDLQRLMHAGAAPPHGEGTRRSPATAAAQKQAPAPASKPPATLQDRVGASRRDLQPQLTPPKPRQAPQPPDVTMPAIFIAPPMRTMEGDGDSDEGEAIFTRAAAAAREEAADATSMLSRVQQYHSDFHVWKMANNSNDRQQAFVDGVVESIMHSVLRSSATELSGLVDGMVDGVVKGEFQA